jgi:hypothetical protein
MKGWIHLTDPLLSNDRRNTYRHTDWLEGFKKYAVEMGSVAMIYIPNFIKIISGIRKLMGGIQTHRQGGDRISLLKESRLKNCKREYFPILSFQKNNNYLVYKRRSAILWRYSETRYTVQRKNVNRPMSELKQKPFLAALFNLLTWTHVAVNKTCTKQDIYFILYLYISLFVSNIYVEAFP